MSRQFTTIAINVLFLVICSFSAQAKDSTIEEVWNLIEQKQYRQAQSLLKKVNKKENSEADLKSTQILIQIFNNERRTAERDLKKLKINDFWIGMSRLYLSTSKSQTIAKIQELYNLEKDYFKSSVLLEFLSKLTFDKEDYSESLKYIQEAYELLNKIKKSQRTDIEKDLRLDYYYKRTKAWLDYLKKLDRNKKLGKAFLAYKNAINLFEQKDFINARRSFFAVAQNYPKSIYHNASILKAIECLLSPQFKHNKKQYIAELKSFIESEKEYDYMLGDAYLQIIEFEMLNNNSLEKSKEYLSDLQNWMQKAPNNNKFQKLEDFPNVTEESLKFIRPPVREYEAKGITNTLVPVKIKPIQILCRVSSDWYWDSLKRNLYLKAIIIYMSDGNKEKAMEILDKISKFDARFLKGNILTNSNPYSRLRHLIQNDAYYAEANTQKEFKNDTRVILNYVDFFYIGGYFQYCRDQIKLILSYDSKLNKENIFYLKFVAANCTYWLDGRKKAFGEFARLIESNERSKIRDRAMYSVGNIAINSTDKELIEKGKKIWTKLIKSRSTSDYKFKAWIGFAIVLQNEGKIEEAQKLLEKFPQGIRKWSTIAQIYLNDKKVFVEEK